MRRILGVLSLAKKYGVASADDACAVALETGASEYHFVRRYLERGPQLPLNLRQVDPLIRQLTLYRDLIEHRTQQDSTTLKRKSMNLIELQRALTPAPPRRHGCGARNPSHARHRPKRCRPSI